ncbi:hypothetical protein [Nostoc sphaeroides]|nr:hypothetical protein [Nostoc sphaeroides]
MSDVLDASDGRSLCLPAGAIASSSVLTKLNKFKNLPLHLVLA